jgi:hypothetical protein
MTCWHQASTTAMDRFQQGLLMCRAEPHLVSHELGAGAEEVLQQAAHEQLKALAVGGWHYIPAAQRQGVETLEIRTSAPFVDLVRSAPLPKQTRPQTAGPPASATTDSPLLGCTIVEVVDAVEVHVLSVPAVHGGTRVDRWGAVQSARF